MWQWAPFTGEMSLIYSALFFWEAAAMLWPSDHRLAPLHKQHPLSQESFGGLFSG